MTVVNPKSISGINSITMASGSDDLLTIHSNNTTERVRVNNSGDVIIGSGVTLSPDGDVFATGITTVSGNVKVGTGITLSPDGDVFFTGIITGNGSGLTNLATDLVNDTSPQLGGNLDTNSFEISLDDSHNINFGDGDDFKIRFDGTNSIVEHIPSGSGYLGLQADTLYIQDNTDGHAYITCVKDGAVGLRYDNSQKLATTNTGVDITGNLSVGSGNGIDFSATSDSAGATSEIFDDYEEGQWTPTVIGTSGAGTATYNTQTGRYLKVGGLVYLTAYVEWNSGSAGGELRISSLPFTPASNCEGIGSVMMHSVGLRGGQNLVIYVGPNNNYTYFYQTFDGSQWLSLNYDSAGQIIMNVTYRTA